MNDLDRKIQAGIEVVQKREGENAEVRRQNNPQREEPTYYRKELERSGHSEWSGGRMGGGTWAGRSR